MAHANKPDYRTWSREALIARLDELEGQPAQSPTLPAANSPAARQPRAFDWSKHSRRRIALKVAYLGWDYYGVAAQGDQATVPTVEAKLFEALQQCRLIKGARQCRFSRCGRTDRGVSGLGQVMALDVRSAIPSDQIEAVVGGIHPLTSDDALVERARSQRLTAGGDEPLSRSAPQHLRKHWQAAAILGLTDLPAATTPWPTTALDQQELPYLRMLNRNLPADIRVLAWAPVPLGFDARFDCLWRHYKYFFSLDAHPRLDIARMRDAAQRFLGTHDFRYFCKLDPNKEVVNYQRTVLEIDITPVEPCGVAATAPWYQVDLRGSAFLWHQVRCMMSILFAVGQGLEDPSVVDWLLTVDPALGRPLYPLASELPLILYDAYYTPALAWQAHDGTNSHHALELNHRTWQTTWANLSTKAHIVQAGLGLMRQTMVPIALSTTRFDALSWEQRQALGGVPALLLLTGGGELQPMRDYQPLHQRKRLDNSSIHNERVCQRKARQDNPAMPTTVPLVGAKRKRPEPASEAN
ncbi:pseudouridine synthase deg1 [Dimargaris verticillata]|uniref:Pseudouridine synthase deg1 n=1 Tax=Dimargaris verticillata TaxID=2761393 RepID=A0A9W8B3C2_9FUNG|nr:pseudouridine synthase deg1 [Dimargaris verticillata]